MQQFYTTEDILRYIYEEMDESESDSFVDTLTENEELWSEYEELREMIEYFPKVSITPSPEINEAIFEYSENYLTKKKFNAKKIAFAALMSFGFMILSTGIVLNYVSNIPNNPNTALSNYSNNHTKLLDSESIDNQIELIKSGVENLKVENESVAQTSYQFEN